MNLSCETCFYWKRFARSENRNNHGFPVDAPTNGGTCQRNPPTPVLTEKGLRSMFPVTHVNHWCGEHSTAVRK